MDPSIIFDYIPKQLLPSLGIPLVELLPDLCLGWWTPPSLDLNKYNRLKYLRVLLLIVAWYPIFELLFPIIEESSIYSAMVIFAVASIIARPLLMEKQIKRVTSIGLWNAVLPKEKREALWIVVTNSKPSDINKFDELAARYVNSPTKISGVVLCIVCSQLYEKLPDMEDKIKLLGGLTASIVGGIGIGGMRHANLLVDIVFRLVFGLGFITMLHYLSIVSDQLIIKSI
mmetsp:Transcript_12248/g.18515  ORF Transcript_12248/g.18515 Transcript_12248/m.18515 type:complete len:229 (-) Transcript_12248:1491-2177(-)